VQEKPKQLLVLFAAAPARQEVHWRPPVDVYRTPDGWLLKFELAGVRLEDISIHRQGGRVTVSGVRRDWVLEEGYHHHLMEIAYSRFERTVELPWDPGDVNIGVEYRDGILLIRLSEMRIRG